MKHILKLTLATACMVLQASAYEAIPPPVQPVGKMYSPDNPNVKSPSQYLKLTKMDVKIGAMPALKKLEAERTAALKKAKWPRTYLTLSSLTGPSQLWVLTRYDKVINLTEDLEFIEGNPALRQEIERIDAAEGALLEAKREVTITYKPAISYRQKFDWTKAKYFDILWIQTVQGKQGEYVQNRIMTREEHDAGGFDTHQMMYQIQSGQQSGTFFVIRPMESMGFIDDFLGSGDKQEPLSEGDKLWKTQLFAVSSLTENEAYWKVESDMSWVQ